MGLKSRSERVDVVDNRPCAMYELAIMGVISDESVSRTTGKGLLP